MLVEAIMHDCIFKLLKNGDEESLECMCSLLHTIGKDLDTEKAKVRIIIFLEDLALLYFLFFSCGLQCVYTLSYNVYQF